MSKGAAHLVLLVLLVASALHQSLSDVDTKRTVSSEEMPAERVAQAPESAAAPAGAKTYRALQTCRARLDRLEAQTKRNITLIQRGLCKVYYRGKCFAVITPPYTLNVAASRTECKAVGGRPGNIYSQDHFNKIIPLIREQTKIGLTYHHIWTGMTLNTQDRTLHLSYGKKAPYARWFPNRPYTPAREHVGIHVETAASSNQGMFDDHYTYSLKGVLCEIKI